MDLELQGKRAIVTGGNRGIGRAIALELAREGAHVVIAGRDVERLTAAAAEIEAVTGRAVIPLVCDTTKSDDVRHLVGTAIERIGGIDILVNNAAPAARVGRQPLESVTEEQVWSHVNVKVLGYLRCAQAVAPHMKAAGWGRIINISGLAARLTGSAVGSIRNVAVAALTKNLADELGPFGINVTVVHPGLTRTEKTPSQLAELAAQRGIDAAEVERQLATNAIRRIVDAQEVAYVVAFLASPKSAGITGDAIAAGGGQVGPIFY